MSKPPKSTKPRNGKDGKPKTKLPKPKGKKAVVKKGKTKPTCLEREGVLDKLESAYRLGATDEEAADFASISITALSEHLKAKTKVSIGKGDFFIFGIDELKDMWKGDMGMKAKMKIKAQLEDKKDTDTKDAWRYLERTQRAKYGLDAHVGSVDAQTQIDFVGEGKKRAGRYAPKK